MASKATVVKVSVKATLDAADVARQIAGVQQRKDVEETAVKLHKENDRLRREIEQMNRQLRNVADEKEFYRYRNQRKDMLDKIDANEKGLILAISGEGLHAEAVLDRRKKEEAKAKIRKFLRNMAANYQLSASHPEIEDNGDGTASVTFEVEAKIQVNSEARVAHAYVTDIAGVDMVDFLTTGLVVQNNTITNKEFDVSCRNKQCKETLLFITNEAAKLVLSVRLGEFAAIEKLARQAHISYRYQKKYHVKMSLTEVKSLSQLTLKILYDGQEYGQEQPVARQENLEAAWEAAGEHWLGIKVKEEKRSYILSILVNTSSSFIITQVRPGSMAETAGMKEGDVIADINGKSLNTMKQYRDAVLLGEQKKRIKLTIRRGIRYFPLVISADRQDTTFTGGAKRPRKAKILY